MQAASVSSSQAQVSVIDGFKAFYDDVDARQLGRLGDIYSKDVQFADPLHALTSLDQLQSYFERAFSGVHYCRFEFHSTLISRPRASFEWTMHYAHPKIRNGRNIDVRGVSVIRFDESANGKITVHQDYYDMGQMLYEQVPLLGRVVKALKGRVG